MEPDIYEATLNVFQDCFDDLVAENLNMRVVPDCDFNFEAVGLTEIANLDFHIALNPTDELLWFELKNHRKDIIHGEIRNQMGLLKMEFDSD